MRFSPRGGLWLAAFLSGCSSQTGNPLASSDASPSPVDASSSDGALIQAPSPDAAGDAHGATDGGALDAAVASDATVPSSSGDGGAGDGATADAGVYDGAGNGAEAAVDATPDAASGCSGDPSHPVDLACTGLYSDWASRTIAPGVRPFTPGLTLWSDGAEKSRWIQLPPGTTIDTSNMDEWTFPVGTKFWKEFRLSGTPVETRLLWKRTASDWFRTTYVWSADGTSATEVTTGVQNVAGTSYEIPPQQNCTTCHMGRVDNVLGFEAVSLAASGAAGLTLAQLVSEGLLSAPPTAPIVVPGDATQGAALGWLHANCGTACHNKSPQALAGSTGLFMRLEVATLASVTTTDTWQTAVNQPSGFQSSPGAGMLRISPRDLAHSAIYFRDSFRDDQGQGFQMPPIDTHVVPDAGVALVGAWIQSM